MSQKDSSLTILALLTLGSILCCQEPRNKIKVHVPASVDNTSGGFLFSYTVSSGQESQQKVWQFWIISKVSKDSIRNVSTISGWKVGIPENSAHSSIRWGSPGGNEILPGESRDGFRFLSNGLVGIVEFYAEGYAPPPSFPEGMAPDSIPGYDDLTPFGPGVVGKTVGPVMAPTPFVPLTFLDTLISYKHQAFDFAWIKNQGIVTSLDQKLENVKDQIQRGNTNAARNILHAFLNEVEALNKEGDQLTSEAYALLRFNTEYLLEKLR